MIGMQRRPSVLNVWLGAGACLLCSLLFSASAGAIDPRFVLDPAEIRRYQGDPPSPKRERTTTEGAKPVRYTVKPGDSLRKILMEDFGMSEAETDAMVPRVRSANGIKDIRRLKVGTTLLIPSPVAGQREHPRARTRVTALKRKPLPAPGQQLRLLHAGDGVADSVTPLRDVWSRLVPPLAAGQGTTLDVTDERYSLAFDPARYPQLSAMDGGKILLDTAGTLPPLVRSLVTTKDPSVRIIAEDPANRRRFVAAVLGAARFYSVEENFTLQVGSDPRVLVFADFKIERTPESLLQHDLTLLNLTDRRRPLPPVLSEYLRTEGFQVLEPFAPESPLPLKEVRGTVYRVTDHGAMPAADTLLQALDLPVSRDRTVELFSFARDGVKLAVKADRLFEEQGQPYVLSLFDGDPVSYTLSRLLETRGYKVIMLDARDDFPKVSERILGRLRLGGGVGLQTLDLPSGSPYAIQLNGVAISNRVTKGKQIVLTTHALSPLLRELAQFNGFEVVE
jgi:hypothetical protein